MEIKRDVFNIGYVLLMMFTSVKATAITVNKQNCGGNTILKVNESLYLNYYGDRLFQSDPDETDDLIHECQFKISTDRQSNVEICIKQTTGGTFQQLADCSFVFKYFIGPIRKISLSGIDFDTGPLCTTHDTVYAVFSYDTWLSRYERVTLELIIYVKPSGLQEKREDWSSWSDNETSDHPVDSSWWLYVLITMFGLIILLCTWIFCCRKKCCNQPVVSNTVQDNETDALPDNPYRNGVPERVNASRNTEQYQSVKSNEDPWKPPDYDSVEAMDQSYYGETNHSRLTYKKTGAQSKREQEDPSPPYPGIQELTNISQI